MADVAEPEREQRKSVHFEDGKNTAEVDTDMNGSTPQEPAGGDAAQLDEVTEMFKGLAKKKKKPKKTTSEGADDGDLVLPAKKKKSKTTEEADDFEAKLAEVESESAGKNKDLPQEGDMEKGTGIWQHDNTTPITYKPLLQRLFHVLQHANPDLVSGGSKSYRIPPPQCVREGSKKTIFANLPDICKRLNRSPEHVTQFLFSELGTTGSTDGSQRLVIKGRFQQKQIENVLRRYIVEYVTCKTCKSQNTELSKGENRLYFLTCGSCGSRRSVAAIKTGFSAQIGKRRRQQG